MYAEERQAAIADLVRRHERCSVLDLAAAHDVSAETVRRDLLALERAGLVRRVHGGAVSPSVLRTVDQPVHDRESVQTDEKARIAEAALRLLPASGTVLLDAGTTTERLAAALPLECSLAVVTHGLSVAQVVAGHPGCTLHLLPGRVRPNTQAAVGGETVEALARLRVDVLFLATNAVDRERGLSTPDHEEAATKRALVRAASRVVLLADATKFGRQAAVAFASLDEVDTVVTDDSISHDDRGWLEHLGIEVVVA